MTNTGHRYVSALRQNKTDPEPWIIMAQGPFKSKAWVIKTHGYEEALRQAIAYRDAQLAGQAAPAAPRRWHRPDFDDAGPRPTERRATTTRDDHRQFHTTLKAAGKIGPYDDVKLASVGPRDLFGTAACMDLDAREHGHEHGRIIVPAPIDPAMAEYTRQTFGVAVVEVWV